MKWLGQHIVNLVSRFKGSVYFEDVENGDSDTDKFLIIGAKGKLKYRTGTEVLSDIGAGTGTGDIDSVSFTTDSGSGSRAQVSSGGANFELLGGDGMNITNSGVTITATAETATAGNPGVVELATAAETQTGTDNSRAVTPNALSQWVGTENITAVGTIETGTWTGTSIAVGHTDAKVTSIVAGDGIDVSGATGDVTVTAENASDTNPGVVELATTAETLTGTSTTLAVTPDGLKDGFKHRQIINLKGYAELAANYKYAEDYQDSQYPVDLAKDYGSATIGSGTEVTQSSLFRGGGFHVPFACTIETIQVQGSINGSGGGNATVAIVEYRPSKLAADQNDYPRTVYDEIDLASNNNNNKIETVTVTSGFDATSVPAGSHLAIMVKGDTDTTGDDLFCSVSIEISW